ncbi:hypothetical protein BDZ94DRAFT_1232710 [Collybia nuda]|uniref:DUF6534 domain-containing protein n=1 Tax=Collybia nuda TaxID=64659 RepID=A0A9P6CIU5_9AGAR|nr:hypothetical protein BDZ94DRAFT_1232710 [Collybia nuda]
MSSPVTPPSMTPGLALDLSDIHGGLYISTHFVAAFWGIACMQVFTYYVKYAIMFQQSFRNAQSLSAIRKIGLFSRFYHKSGKAHSVSSAVAGSADVPNVLDNAMFLHLSPIHVSNLVSGKRKLFPIIFIPAIIGQLVAESVDFFYAYHAPTIEQFLNSSKFHTAAIISNAFPVVIDTGLAVCMTYWLIKESRSARGSHDMIVRLITLTINSGFWTASVALGALITSIVSDVQTYGAVYYVLCALYCNTFLANLNARGYIRRSDASKSNMIIGSGLRFETRHGDHSVRATSIGLEGVGLESSQLHEDSLPSTVPEREKHELELPVAIGV